MWFEPMLLQQNFIPIEQFCVNTSIVPVTQRLFLFHRLDTKNFFKTNSLAFIAVEQTQKKKLQTTTTTKKHWNIFVPKVCAKSLRIFKTVRSSPKDTAWICGRGEKGGCVSELKCFIKIMCAHHHSSLFCTQIKQKKTKCRHDSQLKVLNVEYFRVEKKNFDS